MAFSHSQLLLANTLLIVVTSVARVHGVDLTLVPFTNGSDVVRAVIAKITFSNISFQPQSSGEVAPFMRSMAYVETRDGTHLVPSGGGIWGISRARFNHVMLDRRRDYNSIVEELERDHPNNYIDITDWDNLTYADLNIPLYSGLVARVLIHLNPSLEGGDFANYWSQAFHRIESDWDTQISMLADMEDCTVDTDLVFVLDTSGSIEHHNFQQVRNFVYNFTLDLRTSSDEAMPRVGIITFNETADEYIALNSTIESISELLPLIEDLPYYGGYTNTGAGLELMRQQEWRDDVSVIRLAIVFTDGQSNRGVDVETVSQAVHDHIPPIVVFALGVGTGVNDEELQTIASRTETSSHINSFSSRSFASVSTTYSYQICFTESRDVSFSDLQSGTLERDASIRLRFIAPVTEGLTFRICIRQGRIVIYASTIPNPSSAQYGWRGEVTADSTCLTTFYDIRGETNTQSVQNGRRKKRQSLDSSASDTIPFYISLEGLDDVNVFSFNSSMGNVTLDVDECEDDPCDQHAECYNTDGSFFCTCSKGYTGNGTLCLKDTEHSGTPVTATASVLAVAMVLGMVISFIIIIVLVLYRKRRHKQKKEDKNKLIREGGDNDNDGLLELDEEMFQGCDRRVPAIVKTFEQLASKSDDRDHSSDCVNTL